MAGTFLTRTNSSPTNAKKYTWSSWNKIDSRNWYPFFSTTHQGGHSYIGFGASSSKHFGVIEHGDSAGTLYQVATSSVQADSTGWYHVVVQFDSTQSTASDRLKIYINNVLQTSFVSNNYPSQNLDSWFVDATTIEIGRRSAGSGQYYSGLISHAHFIDGTVYAPSTFGETDSTTGEWKIKTDPGISTANYGNNGFWMFKDNNSLNDNSGNSNNFTVGGGTLTKTEDCPSNVFCTMNPNNTTSNVTLTNGNTSVLLNGTYTTFGTIQVTKGKFYWEQKINGSSLFASVADGNKGSMKTIGLLNENYAWAYRSDGNKQTGGVATSWGNSFTTNDIISTALDMDNGKIWWAKNGVWQESGNPATGANAPFTGLNTSSYAPDGLTPCVGQYGGDQNTSFNFGNGYFGTTAVSSAGTNASGIGIFEYDVPTGYTALSTKGLNL